MRARLRTLVASPVRALVAWSVLALAAFTACSRTIDVAREPSNTTSAAEAAVSTPRSRAPFEKSIGFKSRARLESHFEKHGADLGAASAAAYLALAQALRDAPIPTGSPSSTRSTTSTHSQISPKTTAAASSPISLDVREIVRADGVITRFDARSGAFLAFDTDGTIRTFFKPSDGAQYFERQARRGPPP
jgi:pyocin large subunit-like protein